MTIGRVGALALIGKKYGLLDLNFCSSFDRCTFRFQRWRLDEDGNMEKELKKRGVLEPEILPYYPYRDDGVPLYKLIRDYVTKVVNFFYGRNRNILSIFLY
jgi:hypothetical protein